MSGLRKQYQVVKNLQCRKDGVRALAETIILQSIEDLWYEGEKTELLQFFFGEGFGICADVAGIDYGGRMQLLSLVRDAAKCSYEMHLRSGSHRQEKVEFSGEIAPHKTGKEHICQEYNL